MVKKLDPEVKEKLVNASIIVGIAAAAGVGAYCLVKGGARVQRIADNNVMDKLMAHNLIKLMGPDGQAFANTTEGFKDWTKVVEAADIGLKWNLPN